MILVRLLKGAWERGVVVKANLLFFAIFCILSILSLKIGFSKYAISLNENQVLYLSSSSGQIIAAIYGLTLTGFIFLRNELSREENEDDTVVESIEALKRRYLYSLIFITVLVLIAIFLSNLTIVLKPARWGRLDTAVLNVSQSAFVSGLLAISYFVFDVITPQRIQRISRELQSNLDPGLGNNQLGSLEEFLRYYNRIEELLQVAGSRYQPLAVTNVLSQSSPRKRISNARVAESLYRNKKISETLYGEIRRLISLRNSIIHGADPVVSRELVLLADRVRNEVEQSIGEQE